MVDLMSVAIHYSNDVLGEKGNSSTIAILRPRNSSVGDCEVPR